MKIRFSPQAEADLIDVLEFIAARRPAAAQKLCDRVLGIVGMLAAGDFDGPEQQLTTHEIVRTWAVPPLRLYYQRSGEVLHVVRVYHHARRPIAR